MHILFDEAGCDKRRKSIEGKWKKYGCATHWGSFVESYLHRFPGEVLQAKLSFHHLEAGAIAVSFF